MASYDVAALKEAANCRDVAEFIGMRVSGKYCECVSGLHSETQLNHCAIYHDHIYCFSCGANMNVIKMVMGYYENVLGNPITYTEACRIVGDACGGSELYLTDGRQTKATARPPFDRADMKTILMDAQPRGEHCMTPSLLYRLDPDLYMQTVKERALTVKKRAEALIEELGNTPREAALKMWARQKIESVNNILGTCGVTVEVPRTFDEIEIP